MKTIHKGVFALSLTSLLTGGAALAASSVNSGIEVTGPVPLENLPTEARNGSIRITGEEEDQMAIQTRISAADAVRIATTASPGRVVEVELDDENGFLIWEITQQDTRGLEIQLKLDAGNGKLLAAEFGDHDEGDNEGREDADSDRGHDGGREDEAREVSG